jgi:uncharacterized protein YciI
MYLIMLQYVKPISAIEHFLPRHKEFLEKYCQSGHFLICGEKKPRTGDIILCKANSRREIESILREDPFDQNQLAFYEIIEFKPEKFVREFDELLQ